MFDYDRKIKSVNRLLYVDKDRLYYQITENNTFFVILKNEKYELNENVECGYFFNNKLFIRAISGNSYVITNEKIEKIEYELILRNMFKSKYAEAYKDLNYDLKNQKWVGVGGIYDLEKSILIETEIGLGIRAFINDFIFFCPNDRIIRFNPILKDYLWSYSFADFGKVKDEFGREADVAILFFLGVIENQLWILLNSRQYLVIDVETGKQLALIGDAYDGKQYTNRQFGLGQIDYKGKKIILLSNHQYAEIDCITFKIKNVNLFEEFDKYEVSSGGRFLTDEDYIYFYDKKFIGINQCCKVAILDRKSLKVVWSYDFALLGSFPMQMEKTENNLFVLDGNGTLHIFERENEYNEII